MGIVAAIVAASTAVAVSSASSANKAGKEAKSQQNDAMMRQKQLEADLQGQKNKETIPAQNAARDRAAQDQAKKAAGAYGRRDTILTGPLGLVSDNPNDQTKTLTGV